jgi:dihydroflavonol-4-reductase
MRVLITGATGFLGSHLCQRLVTQGHQVRILCRPASSLDLLANLPIEKVVGDITDADAVQTAVKNCAYVIHAAASLNYTGADADRQLRVNVDGTRGVVQAARAEGVTRLLHVSSVAAIGISADPNLPATEDSPFNLENSGWTYHISKHRAEEQVLAEVNRGLDAVIVNPAMICGPSAGGYRIAEPMKKALASWVIPYAAGGQCLVHLDDVVNGIVLALQKGRPGERYILGGNNVSFREMSEAVCKRFARKRFFLPAPAILVEYKSKAANSLRRLFGAQPLPVYDRRFCYQFYDSSKASAELGYAARDFDSIVEEFASHSEAQTARRDKVTAHT